MEGLLINKLESIVQQQVILEKKLSDPAILSKRDELATISRKHRELSIIISKYREYQDLSRQSVDTKSMISDNDSGIAEMAKSELIEITQKLNILENELKLAILPKDPNDEKNIIVEIRAGAGGNEASLFAGVLFRMYAQYAEEKNWKLELVDNHPAELGGFKEIIFSLEGNRVYSRLKYEQGVHRVQRVPVTEGSGRIHTSTASVAILPEAEEVDIEINPNDLRIDICRSGGPGGQGVNTTDSAVQIFHIPTGLMVRCQDERSQLKNKNKALKVLRARLLEQKQADAIKEITESRRAQIGTADRSEKIRTYNYRENRLTDHRINVSWYKLDMILDGDLNEIIDTMIAHDNKYLLAQAGLNQSS